MNRSPHSMQEPEPDGDLSRTRLKHWSKFSQLTPTMDQAWGDDKCQKIGLENPRSLVLADELKKHAEFNKKP